MKTRLEILIGLGSVLAACAQASTLLVYNTNDSGAGSLRQAILNNMFLGGGNTIIFSNVVTGTITLTTGALFISNNVTILGPGPNVLAVNGNFPNTTNRVFQIGPSNTVTIAGLTVTNGNSGSFSGGGILNGRSTLTVSNCAINGNSSGGIFNTGASLQIVNSTFSGNLATNGGGIFNDGFIFGADLTVNNCTFSGNSASLFGGCIYNYDATLNIDSSTFDGNSAGSDGGGIYNYSDGPTGTVMIVKSTLSGNLAAGLGGGIVNHGGSGSVTLTIINSTLSGNSAAVGGGILNRGETISSATLKIVASTLSGNSAPNSGGGIYNWADGGSATAEVGDTILKTGASGENIFNNVGTVTSDGYNLSSDNGNGVLTNATDQINTDPMLGPLGYYGGPTITIALMAGSPAIDQGKSYGLTTDQRGLPRPAQTAIHASGGDGSCIGAYEAQQLQITSAMKTGNNLQINFTCALGTNYVVQSRADMVSGNWATLPGIIAGNGSIAQTTQTNALSQPQQFYRIQLKP